MAIIRWRPLAELDQLFEELSRAGLAGKDLATDVYEENGNVVIEMQVAGIEPDKVDVHVEGDHVRISGTREEEHETEDRNYYTKEIRRGGFERIIRLPAAVSAEQTQAEIDHGVLKITLPKQSKAEPRRIKPERKSASTERKKAESSLAGQTSSSTEGGTSRRRSSKKAEA